MRRQEQLPLKIESQGELPSEVFEMVRSSLPRHLIRKSLDVLWQSINQHHQEVDALLSSRLFIGIPLCLKNSGKEYVELFFWANECYKSSIMLAIQGYYNAAYSQLRTLLELALLIVYFKDHQIEHQWWLADGNYKPPQVPELLGDYCARIKALDRFKISKGSRKGSNELLNDLKKEYKILCSFVHGRYTQSRDPSTMDYHREIMSPYLRNCRKISQLINTLLVAFFDIYNLLDEHFQSDQNDLESIQLFPKKYVKLLRANSQQ